jgi:hypothetical protein
MTTCDVERLRVCARAGQDEARREIFDGRSAPMDLGAARAGVRLARRVGDRERAAHYAGRFAVLVREYGGALA